ncbi:MAG: GNAT family N-acetyltransferase, partial [Bacteroidales bacterium]|nr:GNAT family N-acetyltransferase [Bacteroidales bacterium]
YVLPSEQGCGLGRMLFEHAAGLALESAKGQVARLELNVNRSNPAVDFYKHLGLRILRQGDFPIGGGFYMNDYIMGIDL